MNDPEGEQLEGQRRRAIDTRPTGGSLILHSHLNRQQEVVAVTRDDLEDILGFDGMSAFFGAFGMFLLSGAGWILVERILSPSGFEMTALNAVCAASVVFGLISLATAFFFHSRKRGRINRIFSQTARPDA